MAIKFVVCLEKNDLGDFSTEDISLGRLYELVDEDAENGMVRIIDESGEDYLYPSSWFELVAIRDATAMRLHDALTKLAA
ncbi:MAG: hypothetical protein JZU52_21415 [Lamprocystis purpurea]|jgi:hypothetical protein|uniref:hypothetical protein n=1 Tax=Lamprocystis purpurea TaxID=61598 RepID=UPI0003A0829B|nr:hypothetical protein [Lamprocystis purpurea]MBV5276080.1 hypothetical protein [Lamprocystis purpurea]